MSLVKKLKIFYPLCLSKIDREKVFADVLDKKKALKTINRLFMKNANLEFFQRG